MKNNKNILKSMVLQCIALVSLIPISGYSQISISDNQTATQLAQNLVGAGVTVTNATLSCPALSNGIFTVTSSNLGLDNGIILTSGRAKTVSGNLGANGAGTSGTPSLSTGNGSDPDLAILTAPNSSNDKCVLQFDFVPLSDSIKFQYVFGSTEYTSYTCSSFSDVFGFFLSGPGISGPFSNNAKNIALVPGTTCPVGVNTINGSTADPCGNFSGVCTNHTMYFVNNQTGTTVAYNGFTTVLNAKSAVTPGQTHHLKLAICDGSDQILDSGVWLKQGSLTSATTTVTQCGPYTWPVNGMTYTASGIYTYSNTVAGNTVINILDLTIFCNSVPTISEWGLIILCLTFLSLGMVFIYKKESSLALAGDYEINASNHASLFNASLYLKVLAGVLAIAVAGLFLSYLYFNSITVTDTIGTVLCAGIVAYMAHLFILLRKNENA